MSGYGILLKFQSNYRTFSPAQFMTAFNGMGFVGTQVTARVSVNPQAPPVETTMYSKGNLLVFLNSNENLVEFHILNTIEAKSHMDQVMKILNSLNFGPMSIANIMATITATVKGGMSPTGGLTRLVDSRLAERLEKTHGNGGRAAVTSIRLSLIRSRDESLTVVLEPFGNDPEGTYYVVVQYTTKAAEKFSTFMEKAGKSMIDDIVKGVEHDA